MCFVVWKHRRLSLVCRITGGNGVRRRTLQAQLDRVKAARGKRVFLVGHSFGCRNTAHLMVGQVEKLSKDEAKADPSLEFDVGAGLDNVAGLILMGYPVCDTKGDSTARRKVFDRMWNEVKVPILLVKGTKDSDCAEFRKAASSLERKDASAERSVHYVEGGGHNPFKGGPARKVDGRPLYEVHNDEAVAAITTFVTES